MSQNCRIAAYSPEKLLDVHKRLSSDSPVQHLMALQTLKNMQLERPNTDCPTFIEKGKLVLNLVKRHVENRKLHLVASQIVNKLQWWLGPNAKEYIQAVYERRGIPLTETIKYLNEKYNRQTYCEQMQHHPKPQTRDELEHVPDDVAREEVVGSVSPIATPSINNQIPYTNGSENEIKGLPNCPRCNPKRAACSDNLRIPMSPGMTPEAQTPESIPTPYSYPSPTGLENWMHSGEESNQTGTSSEFSPNFLNWEMAEKRPVDDETFASWFGQKPKDQHCGTEAACPPVLHNIAHETGQETFQQLVGENGGTVNPPTPLTDDQLWDIYFDGDNQDGSVFGPTGRVDPRKQIYFTKEDAEKFFVNSPTTSPPSSPRNPNAWFSMSPFSEEDAEYWNSKSPMSVDRPFDSTTFWKEGCAESRENDETSQNLHIPDDLMQIDSDPEDLDGTYTLMEL